MESDAADLPLKSPEPAPLGPRILAGVLDTAAIVGLSAALIVSSTALTGGSLPLLAIFVTVLLWSVAPLTAFGATAGMALFGLELKSRQKEGLDLLEVLFREMVGRGWFPVAYLGTLLVGLVASLTGRASFAMPVGLSLFVAAIAGFIVVLAILGHINILTDAQGRGLADLMAKTLVSPRQKTPARVALEPDGIDQEWERMGRARTRRNFVLAELLLLAVGFGLPLLFSIDLPGIDARRIDTSSIEIQGKRNRFEANEASARIAGELVAALESADRFEEAEEVRQVHAAAVAAAEEKQEAFLRAALERNPTDREVLRLLVELLTEAERIEDARQVYADFVAAEGSAGVRAGFGIWLYRRDFNEEAVAVLRPSIAENEAVDPEIGEPGAPGAPSARLHAYLGLAERNLGHLEEAKAEFERALELDPELERTRGYLEEVEAALAPVEPEAGASP